MLNDGSSQSSLSPPAFILNRINNPNFFNLSEKTPNIQEDNTEKKIKNSKMGSLPPSSLSLDHCSKESSIDSTHLLNLFKSQQNYVDQSLLPKFGSLSKSNLHLDSPQFQRHNCLENQSKKISQTFISLGINILGGFYPLRMHALHGDTGILGSNYVWTLCSARARIQKNC